VADSITLFKTAKDPVSGYSVIVEDDGRVCYGYSRSADGGMVADVWLYNRCKAPAEPEWGDRARAPFANPVDFAEDPVSFALPNDEAEIVIRWSNNENTNHSAEIILRGLIIGKLQVGKKPGWALAAVKDGPLAKALQAI